MIGIYKIENKITGECYVGQSKDISKRWAYHRRNASAKSVVRKYPLYRDMRFYGLDAFEFSVLEECNEFKLNDREDYWIDYYTKRVHMYNIKYPQGATRR